MNHRHLPSWLKPAADSVVADNLKLGKWPWLDAVHLLWTIWVFITPMFSGGFTSRWMLTTLWSYPLFVLLYFATLLVSRRSAPLYAMAMIVLSFVLLRGYPSGISYFIFGCVMLRTGCSRSTARYLVELAALNAAFIALASWIGYPWQTIAWVPVITAIIGLIVNVERTSSEKDAALRLSHEEVRRLAATAERERIGRDLHDLLGHTLSLITLKLELSRKLFERDPAASKRELEDAERVAREALAQVRSAVTGIRATDLAAELASARLLLESAQVQLDYGAPPDGLPPDVERGLALVLREAVTNISRHAQATRAQVEFAREEKSVQLCIADNGRGGVAADGNGLSGMRDRVRELRGTLSVESPRGSGTRLLVRVPLDWRASLPPLRVVPGAVDAANATGLRA